MYPFHHVCLRSNTAATGCDIGHMTIRPHRGKAIS
jgi:hypothetical protein